MEVGIAVEITEEVPCVGTEFAIVLVVGDPGRIPLKVDSFSTTVVDPCPQTKIEGSGLFVIVGSIVEA